MATEIKGVHYYNLVCKAKQWHCFTLGYSGRLYLLKDNYNTIYINVYIVVLKTLLFLNYCFL